MREWNRGRDVVNVFFASGYLDHLCTLPTKHQSSVENAPSLSRELHMSWFGTQLPPELSVHWGQTIVNYLKSCQSIQEPCWTFPIPMLSANTKILLHTRLNKHVGDRNNNKHTRKWIFSTNPAPLTAVIHESRFSSTTFCDEFSHVYV